MGVAGAAWQVLIAGECSGRCGHAKSRLNHLTTGQPVIDKVKMNTGLTTLEINVHFQCLHH